MTDFVGTSESEEFIGTEFDDSFTNGGGKDTLLGNGGDDIFILNALMVPGSAIAGGEGNDTLSMTHPVFARTTANIVFPNQILQSQHLIINAQVGSIERIEWANPVNTETTAILGFGGTFNSGIPQQIGENLISPNAVLAGGPGFNQLLFLADYDGSLLPSVTIDGPQFSFENWETPEHAYLPGDSVVYFIAGTADVTLNIPEHDGIQTAITGSGNDTVNGSEGLDFLSSSLGNDQLHGNGGNDTFYVENVIPVIDDVEQPASTFSAAGQLFDGGSGIDTLAIGGAVNFLGTVQSIEAIYLVPEYFRPADPQGAGSGRLPESVLTISDTIFNTLSPSLDHVGEGQIIVNLTNGGFFDGSGFGFDAQSVITYTVNGDAGSNFIRGTSADDILNGNDGADSFTVSAGADTIDGGEGQDIISFSITRNEAAVSGGTNGALIVDGQIFDNIELFRFSDGDYVQAGSGLLAVISGTVADGYIAGATVFVDVNGNTALDVGEPTAVTDSNGMFLITTSETGPLGAFGGTNIDTGLENLLRLDAPEGSTVINPLTTLIVELVMDGADAASAEAEVKAAFGLDASLDLTQTDLISAAATDPAALEAQKAAASVAQVLREVAQENGLVFQSKNALADLIGAGGTVDLTDIATLQDVIGAGLPGSSAQEVAAIASDAQVVNQAIAQAQDLNDITQAQLSALPGDEFSFFVADGFAGEAGGGGNVFGTAGFQDIAILDAPGTVAFDPSFNRGGDIVRLAGDASNWQVSRSGSSTKFSDGDTIVTIPVGTAGMAVVFDDGVQTLRFDTGKNTFKIGDLSFAESPA